MDKENVSSSMDQGDYDSDINCPVVVENLDSNGSVVRKVAFKNSHLTLARNEFGDVVLCITTNETKLRYEIRDLVLHKRFFRDGKATVHLPDHQIRILISNCPPNSLLLFLKTLSCKTQASKQRTDAQRVDLRKRLLSGKPQQLTEISPLTQNDINAIAGKKASRETSTSISVTPVSRKRKLDTPESGTNNRKYNAGVAVQPLVRVHSLLNFDLTEEQKAVLSAILSGRNVFFTGSAGTGKSFLLKKIVRMLPPDVTFVTASTGVAATQIGGTTLHSFAGIGCGSASFEHGLEKITSSPPLLQQWKKCQHLIVDEISMVQGDYFSKLEKLAKTIRKNKQPFGGIQLILCGDFLQLPPVSKENEKHDFCFQRSSWQRCIGLSLELIKVHRQNDKKFIDMLRYIRLGRCTEEINKTLLATANNKLERDGILATHLCTHNGDVNHINEERLRALPGKSHVFNSIDSEPSLSKWFDQQCPVESKLALKVGTQVMLLKNLDVQNGLVNGARGVILKFENDRQGLPIVKFACGTTITIKYERWTVRISGGEHSTRCQLPLKLAWAISIHKAQGMTLDCVEMSLGRVFECGQAYVALSRARSLESLRVLEFNQNCVRANEEVVKFYQQLRSVRHTYA